MSFEINDLEKCKESEYAFNRDFSIAAFSLLSIISFFIFWRNFKPEFNLNIIFAVSGTVFLIIPIMLGLLYTMYIPPVPSRALADPVYVATSTSIPKLAGFLVLDGIQLGDGNRVLVKNQFPSIYNGVYVVGKDDWHRAADVDQSSDASNVLVNVLSGPEKGLWISRDQFGKSKPLFGIDNVVFDRYFPPDPAINTNCLLLSECNSHRAVNVSFFSMFILGLIITVISLIIFNGGSAPVNNSAFSSASTATNSFENLVETAKERFGKLAKKLKNK